MSSALSVLNLPMSPEINQGFDIGGPMFTYREMMMVYAKVAGLKSRKIISSLCLHRYQVIGLGWSLQFQKIARALMESLINEVICKENNISFYIPNPKAG